MFLLQFWIFNLDLSTIISFLLGILIGAVIICGLYAIFVLASLKSKKYIFKDKENDLTAEEVKQMIAETQHAYKDSSLRLDSNRIGYCYSLSEGLVFGIATKFFPKSRHPLLEITIDEALELSIYVEKRLNEILDRKGIRLLKKMKVSSIVELTTKTTNVLDSKAFKVTKEVSGAVSTVKKVINAVNPAWWFKKIVISNTMNIITDKICMIVISIVGEETYKIYSKKVFNEDVTIDSNVDNILEEMGQDINDANAELNPLYATTVSKNEEISFKKNYIVKDNFKYDKIFDRIVVESLMKENKTEGFSFMKFNNKYKDGEVNA